MFKIIRVELHFKSYLLMIYLFLLHDLGANSTHLSERLVRLSLDVFPRSIATPNKYGMLPFHCACLNPKLSIEILMLFISLSLEVIAPAQPLFNVSAKESRAKQKRL